MPHITLNSEEPGIRGLLRYRPETGRPISELAEVLLRGPSTLTRGERELIAAQVSALNECQYCTASHAATAAAVQRSGRDVTDDLVAQARAAGATDLEIHDAVLIAAAFCMMNRYVDGLATIAPADPAVYAAGAQRLIRQGYVPPSAESRP
jgi:AhpD family alkylhydroperoxidase